VSIHHLQLWVPDLRRASTSWGWLLERLGYRADREWAAGRVWRDDTSAIVIEASPDMVPGMLHSRLRPGMNHIAFRVRSDDLLTDICDTCGDAGWRVLAEHVRHPVAGEPLVRFLEDRDGFEVELIGPAG